MPHTSHRLPKANQKIESVQGINRSWILIEKIGEGDAGEVFRVESFLDKQSAVLKRPARKVFPSDVIRQAAAIEREGLAMKYMAGILYEGLFARAPAIYDQSEAGTEFSERYFIVISEAGGVNLEMLEKAIHQQLKVSEILPEANTEEKFLLNSIITSRKMPPLLLLRVISSVSDFLEAIHKLEFETPSGAASGLIWNDIKLNHVYWSPLTTNFTLIDWGNVQYLEQDGFSSDNNYSMLNDYAQFFVEFGRFISKNDPSLFALLDWPSDAKTSGHLTECFITLKKQINEYLLSETNELFHVRQVEAELLNTPPSGVQVLDQLASTHNQLISFGQLPDIPGAVNLLFRLASDILQSGDYSKFPILCKKAEEIEAFKTPECLLLKKISQLSTKEKNIQPALSAAIDRNWRECLWELRKLALKRPEPNWWQDIHDLIRQKILGEVSLTPFVAFKRLLHTIQAGCREDPENTWLEDIYHNLSEEVTSQWIHPEPDPPGSNIDYSDIDRILRQLSEYLPDAVTPLLTALEMPKAQVNIILDAWETMDFETARLGLRNLLLWDPDRQRVILSDDLIQKTPNWLREISQGLIQDEPLIEFITRTEIFARDLHNHVGPASWLGSLLEGFRLIRRGMEPTDVLVQMPELGSYLNWLIVTDGRQPLLVSPNKTIRIDRDPLLQQRPTLYGIKESSLGDSRGIILGEPLDTWSPEAIGSSARLFSGMIRTQAGEIQNAAIKIMRPDRIEYALPLFREEIQILSMMHDIPGVVQMKECGFMDLDDETLPTESENQPATSLMGNILRYGTDSSHNLLADLEMRTSQGWLPYIAIDKLPRVQNLLLLCDTGYTHGRFLPLLEGLVIALQICDILDHAHNRNIIYRDHKILHYYWNDKNNGVFMIDWNIAKRFPEGLSESDIQFDLVQFSARTLHYILTGRPAPGALPLGPNRPEEIETASRNYSAHWTYDDQRLPKDIKQLLEKALAGEFLNARFLRQELFSIYSKLNQLIKGNHRA